VKVHISYAVDLEDVPLEVGKLIDSCENILRVLHADFDMIGTTNPLDAINKISAIRESLATLDLRLGDCSNILGGFVDLQSKIAMGPTTPPETSDVE